MLQKVHAKIILNYLRKELNIPRTGFEARSSTERRRRLQQLHIDSSSVNILDELLE